MENKLNKKVIILSILGLLLVLVGLFIFLSGNNQTMKPIQSPTEEVPKQNPSQNQGIWNNTANFEEVSLNEAPEKLKGLIEGKGKEKGFLTYKENEYLYIFVSSGEKSTGGYGIEVESIEDNEGKTNVYIKEISPEPGSIVTTALTYPSVIVKVKGVTDNVNVISASN